MTHRFRVKEVQSGQKDARVSMVNQVPKAFMVNKAKTDILVRPDIRVHLDRPERKATPIDKAQHNDKTTKTRPITSYRMNTTISIFSDVTG